MLFVQPAGSELKWQKKLYAEEIIYRLYAEKMVYQFDAEEEHEPGRRASGFMLLFCTGCDCIRKTVRKSV